MKFETGMFLMMLVMNGLMWGFVSAIKYGKEGANAACDFASGGVVMYTGALSGCVLVWLIFAFVGGKLTN